MNDDTVQRAIYDEVIAAEKKAQELFLNKFNPKEILPDEYLVKVPKKLDATTRNKWNRATSFGFKWLSEKPANELTRNPSFFGFYYDNSTKLIAVSTEKVKKTIGTGNLWKGETPKQTN